MGRKKHNPNPAGKRGAPVSLYPLSFQDAVSGLAQVQMPAKDKQKAISLKGGLAKIRRSAKP
jgi:hypothetical protein